MRKDLMIIYIDSSVKVSNCYVQEPKSQRSYQYQKKLNSCKKRSSPPKTGDAGPCNPSCQNSAASQKQTAKKIL
jgi:hypothetical protein